MRDKLTQTHTQGDREEQRTDREGSGSRGGGLQEREERSEAHQWRLDAHMIKGQEELPETGAWRDQGRGKNRSATENTSKGNLIIGSYEKNIKGIHGLLSNDWKSEICRKEINKQKETYF